MNPSSPVGSTNRSCLWGNYIMAMFAMSLVAVLLFEYRDMRRNTEEGSNTLQVTTSTPGKNDVSVVNDYFHDHVTQCSYLINAKKALEQSQQRIAQDWNITNYPLFYRMMHIPTLSWDLQKAKFIKLLLEFDEVTADTPRPSYVVGFTGSSVTAGHGKSPLSCTFLTHYYRSFSQCFCFLFIPLDVMYR